MLNLFHSPQKNATWDEPIEMLYACHSKIQKFCQQLSRLPEYVAQHGCNPITQTTAQQILTYFHQAAPLHHDDEELNFFPLLVQYAPHTQTVIDELTRQHHDLNQNWHKMAQELNAVLSGCDDALQHETVARFVAGYAQHIELEEPLFELGKQHIPNDKLREIGQIMAARRHS